MMSDDDMNNTTDALNDNDPRSRNQVVSFSTSPKRSKPAKLFVRGFGAPMVLLGAVRDRVVPLRTDFFFFEFS